MPEPARICTRRRYTPSDSCIVSWLTCSCWPSPPRRWAPGTPAPDGGMPLFEIWTIHDADTSRFSSISACPLRVICLERPDADIADLCRARAQIHQLDFGLECFECHWEIRVRHQSDKRLLERSAESRRVNRHMIRWIEKRREEWKFVAQPLRRERRGGR